MQIGALMRARLVTGRPDETAGEAIRRMLDANVGSIVVCEDNAPVGIFTERDVLRLAGAGADFEAVRLETAMTPNPLTISAEDGILEAAQLMGERRLRHLPVVQDGKLAGMVSMRDVFGFLADRLHAERDDAAAATARALQGRAGGR
jgi:CBS domain-containing protein